jgi:hypothetical protein
MGLLSKITKGGMAKKVVDEARKPENQSAIKRMVSNVTGKGSSTGGSADQRRPGGTGRV